MNYFDPAGSYTRVTLLAPANVTATGNGSGVDMLNYAGNALLVLTCPAGTGTSPTLDLKVQDSADNSTFADVTNASFTQVTTSASVQDLTLKLGACARYIRIVKTVGGTDPSFYPTVIAVCAKEQI